MISSRKFLIAGLGSGQVEPYEAIAASLTSSLTPELRKELAAERGCSPDDVSISVDEVKESEANALRDLRTPPAKRN